MFTSCAGPLSFSSSGGYSRNVRMSKVFLIQRDGLKVHGSEPPGWTISRASLLSLFLFPIEELEEDQGQPWGSCSCRGCRVPGWWVPSAGTPSFVSLIERAAHWSRGRDGRRGPQVGSQFSGSFPRKQQKIWAHGIESQGVMEYHKTMYHQG